MIYNVVWLYITFITLQFDYVRLQLVSSQKNIFKIITMLTDAVFEGGVLCLNLFIPCVNTLN